RLRSSARRLAAGRAEGDCPRAAPRRAQPWARLLPAGVRRAAARRAPRGPREPRARDLDAHDARAVAPRVRGRGALDALDAGDGGGLEEGIGEPACKAR